MGLEVLGPYLAHVHLKNARWAPAGTRDDGTIRWAAAFAPLGEGSVDVPRPAPCAAGGGIRRLDLVRGLLDRPPAAGADSRQPRSRARPPCRELLTCFGLTRDSRAGPESFVRTALDRLPRRPISLFEPHDFPQPWRARVLVMLVMLLGSVLASAAGADTTDDLTRAWQRMVAAQAAADAAAARYEAALAGHARARGPARTDPAAHRRDRSGREGVDEAGAGDRGARVRHGRGAGGRRAVRGRRCARSRSQHPAARSANAPNVATIDRLAAAQGRSRSRPARGRGGREGVGATARVPPIREQPRAARAHRGREREGADRTAHRAGEAAGDPGRRARNRGARRSRASPRRRRARRGRRPTTAKPSTPTTKPTRTRPRRRRSPPRRRRSRTNRRLRRRRRGTGSVRCTVR